MDIRDTIYNLHDSSTPSKRDIIRVLSIDSLEDKEFLFSFADRIRDKYLGKGIIVRGIIEFSNFCRNSCLYCGLNSENHTLKRYRMDFKEIMDSVKYITSLGIKTIVLQSGEDDEMDAEWLARLIRTIKSQCDTAITLSVGEWTFSDYKMWKQAGADRFLLKIETTDKMLYKALHPGMSFDKRIDCLTNLKSLGYQVGSGNIVGLKGQALESIADDLIFFREQDFDMIAIGPFIPHSKTRLFLETPGNADLSLKAIAISRIMSKRAHIPSATAFSGVNHDFRQRAFLSGANVFMRSFTPERYKDLYSIYPGNRSESDFIYEFAVKTGRELDYSRGDAVYV